MEYVQPYFVPSRLRCICDRPATNFWEAWLRDEKLRQRSVTFVARSETSGNQVHSKSTCLTEAANGNPRGKIKAIPAALLPDACNYMSLWVMVPDTYNYMSLFWTWPRKWNYQGIWGISIQGKMVKEVASQGKKLMYFVTPFWEFTFCYNQIGEPTKSDA